jgi:hypothetical protein
MFFGFHKEICYLETTPIDDRLEMSGRIREALLGLFEIRRYQWDEPTHRFVHGLNNWGSHHFWHE